MWHKIICNQSWSETEAASPENPGELAQVLFTLLERDGLDKASDTLSEQIAWHNLDPFQKIPGEDHKNGKTQIVPRYGAFYTDPNDSSDCDYDYIWGIMTDGSVLGTRCSDGATCALTSKNKGEKDFNDLFA